MKQYLSESKPFTNNNNKVNVKTIIIEKVVEENEDKSEEVASQIIEDVTLNPKFRPSTKIVNCSAESMKQL